MDILIVSEPAVVEISEPAVVEEKFEAKLDNIEETYTTFDTSSTVDNTNSIVDTSTTVDTSTPVDTSTTADTSTTVDDTNTTLTVSSGSTTHALEKRCSRLQIENFDLEEFLKKDILGKALLAKGLRSGLSAVDRDRLTDIIIRNLLNEYGKLGGTELEILSKKIEKVFPREFHYTYFVPAITKGKSNQNISEKAKGKLIDKQRNLLYLLKTLKKHEESKDEDDLPGHMPIIEGWFYPIFVLFFFLNSEFY